MVNKHAELIKKENSDSEQEQQSEKEESDFEGKHQNQESEEHMEPKQVFELGIYSHFPCPMHMS